MPVAEEVTGRWHSGQIGISHLDQDDKSIQTLEIEESFKASEKTCNPQPLYDGWLLSCRAAEDQHLLHGQWAGPGANTSSDEYRELW